MMMMTTTRIPLETLRMMKKTISFIRTRRARIFTSAKQRPDNDEDDSSPPKRARKQVLSATDTALDKLQRRRERNKHLKSLKMMNQKTTMIPMWKLWTKQPQPQRQQRKRKIVDLHATVPMTREKPHSFHSHAQTPVVVMQRSGVAKDTCDKIMQARNARFKLQQAQQYHAEDCHVPEPPSDQYS